MPTPRGAGSPLDNPCRSRYTPAFADRPGAFPGIRRLRERGRAFGPARTAGLWQQQRTATVAKKIAGYIKLQIPAGKANPSPPVGPALGQRGLNIMQFVKEFNAATQQMEPGTPTPVVITAYTDRTFSFVTKTPPNTHFLLRAAKLEKGSTAPGKSAPIGRVTKSQLVEIAKTKMVHMNANDVDAAVRMLAGSARSMGLTVVEG